MYEVIGQALVDMSDRSLENDRALLKLGEAIIEKMQSLETLIVELELRIDALANTNNELMEKVRQLEYDYNSTNDRR